MKIQQPVLHGRRDARPTVTIPDARHCRQIILPVDRGTSLWTTFPGLHPKESNLRPVDRKSTAPLPPPTSVMASGQNWSRDLHRRMYSDVPLRNENSTQAYMQLIFDSDVVLETRVLVSRCLEDKNESFGLGLEHLSWSWS